MGDGLRDVFHPAFASDRRAVIGANGQVQDQAAIAGQQIPFPRNEGDRIAAPHEEAVAGMGEAARVVGMHRVVEELQSAFVAAIAVIHKQTAIAASAIDRF